MSGCDLGGAHEVAITIQDIDPFFQLPVPHQDHVTDIGTGWRERGEQGAGVRGVGMAFYLVETTGLRPHLSLHSLSNILNRRQVRVQTQWASVDVLPVGLVSKGGK